MNRHARFALDHPVYDPLTEIIKGHFWQESHDVSAGLTVNLGME